MNIFKHTGFKLFVVLAAIFCIQRAAADNTLKIDPLVFDNYEVQNVPVLFDNTDPVAAMQFDIKIPSWLEFAGNPEKNPDRLLNGHSIKQSLNPTGDNMRVLVVCQNRKPLAGQSGAIMTIPLKVKDGMLKANQEGEITVHEISFTTYNASETWVQNDFNVNVTSLPYAVSAYANPTNMILNPGKSAVVTVGVKNNCDIAGMQIDVKLPEGFTMNEDVVNGSRVAPGVYIQVFKNPGNIYRMIVADLDNNHAVSGNDGDVFTFTMTAPADFAAESAQVIVNKLIVSYAPGKAVNSDEEVVISIVNGKSKYDAAISRIESLEAALAAAAENIATNAPDVKDNFPTTGIASEIENLKSAVEADYESMALENTYDDLMAQATQIESEIDALVAAALKAEAEFKAEADRVAANQAAYDADVKAIDEMVAALEAQLAQAVEENGEYVDMAAANAIIAEANALKDAAAAALAAVAEEGAYKSVITGTTAADLAAKMQAVADKAAADKAAAEAEADRVAANKAAYDADVKAIDEMVAALEAQLAQAVEETGEYVDMAAANAIIAEAKALKDAAAAALAAVAEEGAYKSVITGTTAADFAVKMQAVADKAADDKAAAEAEADRVAANQAAYDADVKAIDEMVAALEAQLAQAVEENGEYVDMAAANAIIAEAKALKDAAAAALAAVAEEGAYKSVITDTTVADLAAKMQAVADKAAADKAAAEAEADRVAANKAAYDADMAALKQLQKDLNSMSAKISDELTEYKSETEVNNVQEMINDAKEAAEAAYAAVATEGAYSYQLDVAAIQAAIQGLMDNALNRQRQANNQAAYQADLSAINEQVAALEAMLAQVIAEVGEEFVNVDAANAVINKAKALKESAAEALAAVAAEGAYAPVLTAEVKAELVSEMQAVCNAAKAAAAQSEADRQAANQAAYEADVNAIDQAVAALEAQLEQMKEEYGEYVDLAAANAIIAEAKALKEVAAEALAAVSETGAYKPVMNDAIAANLAAKMQAVADKAAADKAAAEAETDRAAANQAAYDSDMAKVAELQHSLDLAIQDIRDNYTGFQNAADEAMVQAEINALTQAANAELARVAESGEYASVIAEDKVSEIEAMIDKLVAYAAARKEAAEAEAQRKADNLAAYEADLAKINELQNLLNETAARIQDEYGQNYSATEVNKVQKMINDAKTAVEREYRAVANEGVYSTPAEFDTQAIEDAIAILWETAGLDSAISDFGDDAEYYDLSGNKHEKPVKGCINIVKSHGTVTKVYAK